MRGAFVVTALLASVTAEELEAARSSRRRRQELRRFQAGVSGIGRVSACGMRRIDKERGVELVREGLVAHVRNVQRCGSCWSCPWCGPKIAQGRALEIRHAVLQHLGGRRRSAYSMPEKGGVYFLTATVPHDLGDDLAALWDAVVGAWRRVWQGQAAQDRKAEIGYVGMIRSFEVTVGYTNGWHPHLHCVLFLERELVDEAEALLLEELKEAWADAVEWFGLRRPHERYGLELERVVVSRGETKLGEYLTKLAGRMTPEFELARGDLKRGRVGNWSAWQLLELAYDRAVDDGDVSPVDEEGRLSPLALWRIFESASRGRNWITWSPGLKAMFDLEERTDEELAAEEVGGVVELELGIMSWRRIMRRRNGVARVLEELEERGAEAALALISDWLDPPPIVEPAQPEQLQLLG